jgi:PAS domain S-box-containing protein
MSESTSGEQGCEARAPSTRPPADARGATDSLERQNVELRAENERLSTSCPVNGARRRVCEAVEHLLEGCMIIGRDWRYLYVNEQAARHGQQRRENLIGRTILEMYPGVERTPIFAAYRRCMEDRAAERFEAEFTFPDGTCNWYLFSVEPVPEGIFVLSLDITDRVRAEQELKQHRDHLGELVDARTAELGQITDRYRSLFSTMTEGFALHEIVCDPSGIPIDYRFLDINPAFERLTGLPRAAVVGHLQSEVLPGEHGSWLEVCGKVALTGEPTHVEGLSESLGRHYQALVYCPRPGQFAVVFLDITTRKRLELERERHLAAVAEADAAKDLFFSTLSHELRTPLAAMLTSVEVLKSPAADSSQRARVLGILERNVKHQARLIDELLDLSRIMRGKVEIANEPLDLRDVVAAQTAAAEPLAAQARLVLRLEAGDQPVPILGDATRLGQVAAHLLSNAIKFTPPGGSVTVRVDIEHDQALLRVADTGMGIRPELLPRLFEPFHQGDPSSNRGHSGLGIGLAIARSLTELHGGRVEASSAGVDQGAMLTVRLPLSFDWATGMGAEPAVAPRARCKRVLVIEDNADLRDTLAIMLRLLGHTAILAPTGSAGLALARAEPPDAALVDIGLPDVDGYEVARALRADAATRHIRLVALTGYATAEHRERAAAAGFDHHLPKPAEQDDLRRVLGD